MMKPEGMPRVVPETVPRYVVGDQTRNHPGLEDGEEQIANGKR